MLGNEITKKGLLEKTNQVVSDKKKMTIIIVAFNAEEFIESSIESALQQSLSEIEIICVDDGSTDRTLSIMQTKSDEDARIIIIPLKQNCGPLYARKIAVERANSKYVLFLDADDELIENACYELYYEMERNQSDVLCFSADILAQPHDNNHRRIEEIKKYITQNHVKDISNNGPQLIEDCFVHRKFLWCVWNKCYSLDLQKRIYSAIGRQNIKVSEDLLVTFMTLCYAHRFHCVPNTYYRYRIGSGITTKDDVLFDRKTGEEWVDQYQVLLSINQWIEDEGFKKEEYKTAIGAINDIVANNVIAVLFGKVNQNYLPELINRAILYRNKEDFLLDVLMATNKTENHLEISDVVFELSKTGLFVNTKGTIKTVGMYYRRMYNGGVERVISLLTPILEKAGYRVVIITEEYPNELDYPLPAYTVRTVLGKSEKVIERVKKWWEIISVNAIDMIIYHGWLDPNVLYDQIAIKGKSIPFLLYTHSSSNDSLRVMGIPWHSPDKAYALVDLVITISEADKAWWNTLGFPTKKVKNPCSFDCESQVVADGSSNSIIWIGRINDDIKQFREAVQIVKIVHEVNKNAVLDVIGITEPPELLDQICKEVEDQGASEFVVFHGYQSDMKPFYQSAKICLSTSVSECFPMVYIESKKYGIPIVAYKIDTTDFHRKPKGMIIVPQRDREKAANGILQLLENKLYWEKLSKEAIQEVEELYNTPLHDVWKEIIENINMTVQNSNEENYDLHMALISYLHMTEKRIKHINEEKRIIREENEILRNENKRIIGENCSIIQQNQKLFQEKFEINHQLYSVFSSNSWKIGRVITHIPRVIKGKWQHSKVEY